MELRVRELETQLARWGARLEELVVGARQAHVQAEVNYALSVENLRAKYNIARYRLDAFKEGREHELGALKVEVESAWEELEIAFTRMAN